MSSQTIDLSHAFEMAIIVLNATMLGLKELYFYYFSGGFSTAFEAREGVGKIAFHLYPCVEPSRDISLDFIDEIIFVIYMSSQTVDLSHAFEMAGNCVNCCNSKFWISYTFNIIRETSPLRSR